MIIDAKDLVVGRMATVVAKKALLGEKISIVNSEKAVLSGDPKGVIAKFKTRYDRGTPAKGPFIPRQSHMLLKRMIRGMLPYKKARGREAFENIKCYVGIPDEFAKEKLETIEGANVNKLPVIKFITIEKVSKTLGGKQ